MKAKLIAGAVIVVGVLWAVFAWIGAYNRLVTLEEHVAGQWSQVENVYQRRADLVPNLVATVRGAASFERETLTAVIEARNRALDLSAELDRTTPAPERFAEYQKTQDALSNALSRLLVVVERYPELGAVAAFRDLMTQLEGTENRITVERMRYNEVARAFNTERRRFPTLIVTTMSGAHFAEKPYFKAREGAESAPQVKYP